MRQIFLSSAFCSRGNWDWGAVKYLAPRHVASLGLILKLTHTVTTLFCPLSSLFSVKVVFIPFNQSRNTQMSKFIVRYIILCFKLSSVLVKFRGSCIFDFTSLKSYKHLNKWTHPPKHSFHIFWTVFHDVSNIQNTHLSWGGKITITEYNFCLKVYPINPIF